jgi:hypothetical protein
MYQPVMKMKIVFDEEKVKREGKYDINSMYDIVDDYFIKHNLSKIGKGEYADRGNKDDYAMIVNTVDFEKLDWFKNNLSSWLFSQIDENTDNWYCEDWLAEMKNSRYRYA